MESPFEYVLDRAVSLEIFIDISIYLSTDVIPVRLILTMALMAITRKVIIIDFEKNITTLYLLYCSLVYSIRHFILADYQTNLKL